jgi:DUF3102 family protein
MRSVACVPAHDTEPYSSFDYGSVSPDVAKFLKGQAKKIIRTSANSVVQIGKDLIAAKHFLDHGAFQRWLDSEVGIRARTAQAYMQVARWISSKNPAVARLPPSVLYLLSAPSTPERFMSDVLKRVDAGENLVLPVIRNELKALRKQTQPELRGESSDSPHSEGVRGQAGREALMELVAILAQRLSPTEFARVRAIMTNESMLHDAAFAQNVALAFSSTSSIESDGNGRGRYVHI